MHRKWYQRHPDYIDRVLTRAKPYLWYIRIEVLRRGMPGEIALLPVVESAFDPYANSSHKAAGLWQIIPATASRFKVRRDSWYDGRHDVIDSTRAALDYLEKLHRRFNGDWLLALAAYNSGEGTVSKAIRRNKKLGKPTDFWNLKLPKETRDYVPNLLALCNLVTNSEARDIHLPDIPNRPYFDVVDTHGPLNLATAAKQAGISFEELHQLNAGFRKSSTPPTGPHRLLIPFEHSDNLLIAQEKKLADETLYWVNHKISEGETLGHIALRYNTSIRAIRQANNLRSNVIRINKTLSIPAYDETQSVASTEPVSIDDDNVEHVVKNGDTLWDLARHYKVSVTELRHWNDIPRGRYLRPGQRLKLFLEGDTVASAS
jgi:membrane-bound lytic murein transglycosylase D